MPAKHSERSQACSVHTTKWQLLSIHGQTYVYGTRLCRGPVRGAGDQLCKQASPLQLGAQAGPLPNPGVGDFPEGVTSELSGAVSAVNSCVTGTGAWCRDRHTVGTQLLGLRMRECCLEEGRKRNSQDKRDLDHVCKDQEERDRSQLLKGSCLQQEWEVGGGGGSPSASFLGFLTSPSCNSWVSPGKPRRGEVARPAEPGGHAGAASVGGG